MFLTVALKNARQIFEFCVSSGVLKHDLSEVDNRNKLNVPFTQGNSTPEA